MFKPFLCRLFFVLVSAAALRADPLPFPLPFAETEALTIWAEEATLETWPDADEVLLNDITRIRYEADGTYVEIADTAMKVLTEKGRRNQRTVSRHFDEAYERVRLERLEIIRPDGTVVPVNIEAQSRIMTDPGQMGSNIYNPKSKILQAGVPGLEIGDTVRSITVREVFKTRVPNTWSDYTLFEYTFPFVQARHEVTGPESLPLKKIALNAPVPGTMTAGKTMHNDGTITWHWEARQVPQAFKEPQMPALHTQVQRLLLSTIESWEELSKWYWNLSLPRLEAVTPEMEAKVIELLNGIDDPQKQIETLFYFVSQQIRYMGITIEDEAPGYEPHDVSLTFENRYGVCRDKAALLVALLRMANHNAFPVLIMAGPKKDPEVPQPFFNHAIVAVENADGTYQLMDPTDENTRDLLPAYLCDCSYLVARPEGDTLRTSPIIPADENLMRIETEGFIENHTDLNAVSHLHFDGINDTVYRGHFSRIKPERRREFFEGRLKSLLPGAELIDFELQPEEIRDTDHPLSLRLHYRVPDLFIQDDDDLLYRPRPLSSVLGIVNFILEGTGLQERKYPLKTGIACGARESFRIRLNGAAGEPVLLPDFDEINTEELYWHRSVTLQDDEISGVTEFQLKTVEFSPAAYLELKEHLKTIEYNHRKKLLFRTAPPESDPEAETLIIDSSLELELPEPGRWISVQRIRQQVLNYAGKKKYSELKFPFNPVWEKVELLSTRVTAPDGTVREITEKELNLMDADWAASAPRYPAEKLLVANLPGVEPGSVIDYEIRRTAWDRPFFSTRIYFSGTEPVNQQTVILRSAGPVKTAQRNAGSLHYSETKDRDGLVMRWEAGPQPGVKAEPDQPPQWATAPTLLLSSGDWKNYAKALHRTLTEAARHQPAARAKAREVCQELRTRLEKAEALRDFVAENIRPAGPHLIDLPLNTISPADRTLADGYGHAADRAVLLYALLESAGLRPEFVIASSLPRLEETAQPLIDIPQRDVFNQPLVRIRSGKEWIYLNDTDQYARLGTVHSDWRTGLSLKSGKTVPVKASENCRDREESRTAIALESNGGARIEKERFFYGTGFAAFHRLFAELPPEERRRFQQELVSGISQSAIAETDLITDGSDYPGRQHITVRAERYAVRENDLLHLILPAGFGADPGYASKTRRKAIWMDEYVEAVQTVTVTLPDGFEPAMMPDPQVWILPENGGRFVLERTFFPEKNQIELHYRTELRPALIPADHYETLQRISRELAHPQKTLLLLRKKTVDASQ